MSVPINIPSFFKFMMKIFSPMMSKKMIDKMKACPGDTNGDITKCPFVMSQVHIEDIPTFLGGKCNCPGGGCINGVPNSQTVMNAGGISFLFSLYYCILGIYILDCIFGDELVPTENRTHHLFSLVCLVCIHF